ncbi:hypothetical protein MKX01_013795 [Papaver californicum]|nr:hypothetical protein MKX01_013795 [Papaver californicum]
MQGKQPLFSFGVISDVHYADIPDGRSYLGVPRTVRNWNNEGKFKLGVPRYYMHHMTGNHCLYNLPPKDLLPLLKIPTLDGSAYYDFSPTPDAIGWPHDHPKTLQALKLLPEKNPNTDKNSPSGLVGLERRFLKFNEGIKKRQKVVVCCHMPLDPGASSKTTRCWNYDTVMEIILYRYDCMKVCIA